MWWCTWPTTCQLTPGLLHALQTLKGPDGKTFKVTKGAPHIIAKLCSNEMIREAIEAEVRRPCLVEQPCHNALWLPAPC